MQKSTDPRHRPLSLRSTRVAGARLQPRRLVQLLVALTVGCLACALMLSLLALTGTPVRAAPPLRPLTQVITGTVVITHTSNTTHEMTVYADGRATDQFLSDNGRNQIDQNGSDPLGTTIAVLFDQHPGDQVDVGVQGDFAPTTPLTKLITIFYGLNGVIVLLMLFDVIRRLRRWDVGDRSE